MLCWRRLSFWLFVVAALIPFMSVCVPMTASESDMSGVMAKLSSDDPEQRLEAIRGAMAAGDIDSDVVSALVDRLADADAKVAQEAALALEAIGTSALPALSEGLRKYAGTSGIILRRSIVQIMGNMGGDAVSHLIPALSDLSPAVKRASIAALEGIGRGALPASDRLSEVLMDVEEDPSVRGAAAAALAAIGATDESSVLALVLGRVDANLRVAFAANTALSKLDLDTKVLVAVLLEAAENPKLALSARDALLWVMDNADDSADAILEILQSGNVSERIRLAQELLHSYGRLNSDKKAGVIKAIRRVLEDEDAGVREVAISSLSGLDESATALVPVLASIALDSSGNLEARRAAISGWEHIGESMPGMDAELISLAVAEDEDEEIRRSAVSILAASNGDAKDVADMILDNLSALRDEWQWRLAPVIVEAGQADQAIVSRLATRLRSDASAEDRLYAVRVLSAIGSEARSAVPALIDLLPLETDSLMRRAITRAIVEIAGDEEEARAVLASLAEDEDCDVRRIARTAIGLAVEKSPAGPVPAFPGAEGFGMWTAGGRGGKVYVVTNLDDSGPGSLREAVEASGPRIVVFAVSGTIHLKSRLDINKPHITIAGQTAPGEGITIADYDVVISADEVVLRYLRVRLGDRARQEVDTLWINGARNVIVDHVSSSWSIDETFSVSASDNVTVQWCFITESLNNSVHSKGPHGYGSLVRGEFGGKYTFHHNLWAHHSGRMPRPGNYTDRFTDEDGLLVDFRNNVFYNWGRGYSGSNHDTNSITKYNFINNYYKLGPNSTGATAFREECPYAQAYFAGNMMNGVEPKDPWSLVDARLNRTAYLDSYRQSEPLPVGFIQTESADLAYERVLAEAGMHPRDDVDARIVDEVIHGRGRIINSQNDVGGWPRLRSEAPAVDSRGDAIPDWWYVMYGFDPRKGLDPHEDLNGSGYTNIEEYLNGTDPDHYVDYRLM